MPQMAPLWWEILFTMFIVSFLFMNIIIYFNKVFAQSDNLKDQKINAEEFKWKW
uniref:ATP synthase complex subunit 8 n=1 Tax=Pseudomictis brevicornis TaxID=2575661 RepID=A0A4D6X0K4_9HEMI|nr:ATP synthase F0 subunit 8 [Pseudomictis brevicornis]QCI09433.1 ATP synthase F0 subunit 8 [Pseudomictis brevicornis]